jgi:hypothetical protein
MTPLRPLPPAEEEKAKRTWEALRDYFGDHSEENARKLAAALNELPEEEAN